MCPLFRGPTAVLRFVFNGCCFPSILATAPWLKHVFDEVLGRTVDDDKKDSKYSSSSSGRSGAGKTRGGSKISGKSRGRVGVDIQDGEIDIDIVLDDNQGTRECPYVRS